MNILKLKTGTAVLGLGLTMAVSAQVIPQSQIEHLDRGLTAIAPSGNTGQTFISWRLLGTDDANTTFDLLRNGETIASDLKVTNYKDTQGSNAALYQVVTKQNGQATETSASVTRWKDLYQAVKLDRPEGGKGYGYFPNDCSVADLDGDGQYEMVIKWDPSNNQDNSKSGRTGNVYLDAYRLDGTKLWRIDLGQNIRAGAHYTQFLVYDFNGDGRAELICKTAPGSIDGLGNYVTAVGDNVIQRLSNTTDFANENGYILKGAELLTVFEGTTGRAVNTTWYSPNRMFQMGQPTSSMTYDDTAGSIWGDNYGNRCDRYLACVAYLDGPDQHPSAVMCRGYYTRSYLWAVDFDGEKLKTKWIHGSISGSEVERTSADGTVEKRTYSTNTSGIGTHYTAYGQGCHSLAVGDVDGDGCDEIIYGSAAIDNDGWLLHSTGLGHGDALHLSDLMPDREGLEVMMVHEEAPYGWSVRDARTGELLIHHTGISDTGRGIAADIFANHRGFEFWHSDDMDKAKEGDKQGPMNIYSTEDKVVGHYTQNYPFYNFRIYWSGNVQDELFDKGALNDGQWNRLLSCGNYGNSVTYGSKANPLLIADIMGDWREEIIMFDKTDSCTVNIFSTTAETTYRVPTLMHDHIYRMSVAWQNVGYNQPPHLGYYLPDYVEGKLTDIRSVEPANQKEETYYDLRGQRVCQPKPGTLYIVRKGNETKKIIAQ